MAREFSNKNTGALFNNQDRKEKENDRDYGGSINVVCPHCSEGSDHWLSGWLKESTRTGAKFLSLAVKPKVPKEVVAQPTAGNGQAAYTPDPDDGLAF